MARSLEFYINRYGEEEGRRRHEQAVEKESDPPMDEAQALPGGGGRERAPRRRSRKPDKRELTLAVGGVVATTDMVACWLYPPWAEEHLEAEEIGRLSNALADEIISSERLTKWFLAAQSNSVHARLALVLAMIAAPRLARRGLLPAGMFGMPGGGEPGQPSPADQAQEAPSADAVPVAPGPAHGDHRDDWLREVDPGLEAVGAAAVPGGAEEQSGRRGLWADPGGVIRDSNGRPSGLPSGAQTQI